MTQSALLDVSPSSSAASIAKEDESLEKSLTTRKMGIEPLLPNLLKHKGEHFGQKTLCVSLDLIEMGKYKNGKEFHIKL